LLKIAIAIFDLVEKEHRAKVEEVLVNYEFFSKTCLRIFFGQLATVRIFGGELSPLFYEFCHCAVWDGIGVVAK
jgi:hypothetical protein